MEAGRRSSSGEWEGKKKKNGSGVLLEGYVDDQDLARTKSLTDEDLEELKGCLDLGFGFSYDEIPELCSTLPALELCYSMSQKFTDNSPPSPDSVSNSFANWKISSPAVRASIRAASPVRTCITSAERQLERARRRRRE